MPVLFVPGLVADSLGGCTPTLPLGGVTAAPNKGRVWVRSLPSAAPASKALSSPLKGDHFSSKGGLARPLLKKLKKFLWSLRQIREKSGIGSGGIRKHLGDLEVWVCYWLSARIKLY